jgi:hypothetical protein
LAGERGAAGNELNDSRMGKCSRWAGRVCGCCAGTGWGTELGWLCSSDELRRDNDATSATTSGAADGVCRADER